jgi:hypothetical protein
VEARRVSPSYPAVAVGCRFPDARALDCCCLVRFWPRAEGLRLPFQAPQDTNAFSFGTMVWSSNVNQCVQTKDAGLNIRNGVLAYKGFFSFGGRLDAFPFSPIGCDTRSVIVHPSSTSLNPVINASSGPRVSDPYLGFRGGFIGPALEPTELVKHEQGFLPYGPAGAYLPTRQYNSSKPLNRGVTGQTVRFGVPMVMPLANPSRPASLDEIPAYPGYENPFGGTQPVRSNRWFE